MRQLIFSAMLVYTWALSMFVDDLTLLEVTRGSPLYVALVLPAVLIVVTNLDCLFSRRHDRSTLALALFAGVATAVSVVRGDIATAVSVLPLCATLIAIHNGELRAELGLINGLFVASILVTLIMQAVGSPSYGVVPGYSLEVEWRVSLFPHNVTPSWLFALIVLFANYFRNRQPVPRLVFMAAAFYFIALSASRTSIIVVALVAVFLGITRLALFRDRPLFRWMLPATVLMFVLILSGQALLALLVQVDNPLLNAVLFRSESGAMDMEAATASIYRTIIWGAHLDAFLQDPLFGHGTFEFADLSPEHADTTGSEAFITALMARTGLAALLVIYFIHRMGVQAAQLSDRFKYALAIMFAITSLTYGSYIVPYNFIFLLLFGAFNLGKRGAAPARDDTAQVRPAANSA